LGALAPQGPWLEHMGTRDLLAALARSDCLAHEDAKAAFATRPRSTWPPAWSSMQDLDPALMIPNHAGYGARVVGFPGG
jgi:hypothetical protein